MFGLKYLVMKTWFTFVALTAMATLAVAQSESGDVKRKKYYVTSGGELIFSMANLSIGQMDRSTPVRFSAFFNGQTWVHFDRNEHFGFFSGMSLRNVGFIYDVPGTDIRKKARTYNLGIPLAVKFGNMDGTFVYAGYEAELAFNYKEKTFVNDDKKEKFNRWFSDRVNIFQHGFFVGIQLPHEVNIKFKYYLSKFYNSNYSMIDTGGVVVRPYENIDANVFYFSLSIMLRREKMEERFRRATANTYSTRL